MLKDCLGCVSRMEVVAGVSTPTAVREHKEAPCFASPMVEANGVYLKVALKGPRAAHRCVKGMVVGRGASLREVGPVLRVFMAELTSALLMEGANAVLYQGVPRVLVVAPIAVLGMVVASVASLMDATRVHRGAQTSARRMVGGSDAFGALVVRSSPGEGAVYALYMEPCWLQSKSLSVDRAEA